MDFKIALTGNPNVGKTSLFNRLTRSFEHVGNWHGVTVKKTSKHIRVEGEDYLIDDLPGLYSLSTCSFEEAIARDGILFGGYDVVISICEVNNLCRNLYLTLQLLELDIPVVLVVNMIDEIEKRGKELNIGRLESSLGIPVIALSAKYKIDAGALLNTCRKCAESFIPYKYRLNYLKDLRIERIGSIAAENIKKTALKPRFAAIKLLENDSFVADSLCLSDEQNTLIGASVKTQSEVAAKRYEFIEKITSGTIVKREKSKLKKTPAPLDDSGLSGVTAPLKGSDIKKIVAPPSLLRATDGGMYKENAGKIDRILLNRYLALPIFLLIMAAIFAVTFGLVGKWMSSGLAFIIEKWLYLPVTSYLSKMGAWDWFNALIGEGIIKGVGGILVFLPQIVLLFFFLALLEDSGYISRVAFMTDGFFRKIGLCGRSAFTMLMGFGCSATAVLTARGLEDDNMRKKTVLLTPFMSCSARLPVYSAIGAAFFLGANPLVIFLLYFLGAFVAFCLAGFFESTRRLKSGKLSFIMEMPPYRLPTAERVCQIILHNSKVFLLRVGSVIFALNVLVWVLANFSVMGYTAGTDYQSFLESIGSFIAKIFVPLGFGNWEAVTALLSGLVAKESVLASIESLGGLSSVFLGEHQSLTALCFLVFTLLYVPCIATLSAIAKEIGARWAAFSLVLQLSVAYLVALITRGLGLLFIYHPSLFFALVIGIVLAFLLLVAVKYYLRHAKCSACMNATCRQRKHKEKQ